MHMRKNSRYLFILALYIISSAAIHAQAVEVKIRNETDYRMQELYLFDDPTGARGENRLSASPLFPGREATVAGDAGVRFVLAVDSEGDRYLKQNVDLEENRILRITLDDLHFGSQAVASGVWELRVLNDTNYRLTRISYRAGGDGEWTEVEIDSPIGAGDLLTRTIPVPSAAASIELRAEDEDGDVYRKSGIRVDDRRSVRFTFDDLQW